MEDEYVRGLFHTNSVEGSFGLFKRMIYSIYHQTSKSIYTGIAMNLHTVTIAVN